MRRSGSGLIAAAVAGALAVTACSSDGPTDSGPRVDDFLGCERVSTVQVPGSANATLAASDCTHPVDGSYVDYYAFQLNSSRQVTINMASDDVDSYLWLYEEDGTVLDQDDDGGSDGDDTATEFDAEITMSLGPGTYVIAANSWDSGEIGSYTLRVD